MFEEEWRAARSVRGASARSVEACSPGTLEDTTVTPKHIFVAATMSVVFAVSGVSPQQALAAEPGDSPTERTPAGVEETTETPAEQVSRDFRIVELKGVPEVKTEWVIREKCVKVLKKRKCVKTKLPKVYQRHSTKEFLAAVSYPKGLNAVAVQAVETCGKIAAASATAGALAGGPPAALGAFRTTFSSCIVAQAGLQAKKFHIRIKTETSHSEWKAI